MASRGLRNSKRKRIIIIQLDRVLEKGFVLIRNLTLPGSDIVEPIILIGQGGVYVIYVTHLRGQYEAKGDQWNVDNNGRPQPASINLMSLTSRLARALGRYLQMQKIDLPVQVEPVLIAADPGMHIELDAARSASCSKRCRQTICRVASADQTGFYSRIYL